VDVKNLKTKNGELSRGKKTLWLSSLPWLIGLLGEIVNRSRGNRSSDAEYGLKFDCSGLRRRYIDVVTRFIGNHNLMCCCRGG